MPHSPEELLALVSNGLRDAAAGTGFDQCMKKARIVEAIKGSITCEMTVDTEHLNIGGTLHGGATSALIDLMANLSFSTMTHPFRIQSGVTVDLSVSYIASVPPGKDIVIKASVMKAGKKMVFIDVDVKEKEHMTYVAKGKVVFYNVLVPNPTVTIG